MCRLIDTRPQLIVHVPLEVIPANQLLNSKPIHLPNSQRNDAAYHDKTTGMMHGTV
jgi:hypothetical protein